MTGELEPIGENSRHVTVILSSPIPQGATQAGDLQALGARSSPNSEGEDLTRAVQQIGGKPWRDLRSGSSSWATLPFLPCCPFPWLGNCRDSRVKVVLGATYLRYFCDSISSVEARGSSLLFPSVFCMQCSSPAQQFPVKPRPGVELAPTSRNLQLPKHPWDAINAGFPLMKRRIQVTCS